MGADSLFRMGDSVQKDYLGPMGLDPNEWDLSYEPVQPKMKPTSGAYHPGFRGMLERVGPVLGEAFSEADFDSPYARMAARLAKAYGHHLQSGVDDRMGDITAENKAAMGAADEQNAFRRTQVSQNRASYLSTARDRLPTPRAVLEQKNAEKRAAAKEAAMGRVEGTVEARVAAGLPKQGTGRTTKPKSYDPSSFKLFGDADKIQIDEIDQAEKDAVAELKSMNSDYTLKQAFQPVRKINGKPVKEGDEVMAARMRKAELDKAVADARGQKRAAGKRALLWHAANLGNSPDQRKGTFMQLVRSAESLGASVDPRVWRALDDAAVKYGLDKDPDVETALDAMAEAVDKPEVK